MGCKNHGCWVKSSQISKFVSLARDKEESELPKVKSTCSQEKIRFTLHRKSQAKPIKYKLEEKENQSRRLTFSIFLLSGIKKFSNFRRKKKFYKSRRKFSSYKEGLKLRTYLEGKATDRPAFWSSLLHINFGNQIPIWRRKWRRNFLYSGKIWIIFIAHKMSISPLFKNVVHINEWFKLWP